MPIRTTITNGVLLLTGTRDDGETDHHKTLNGTASVGVLVTEITAVVEYPILSETEIYAVGVERRQCGTVNVPINRSERVSVVQQLTAVWSDARGSIADDGD